METIAGDDVTAQFIRGAEETLYLAQQLKIRAAILKARSPSCGNREIYDGSHRGILRPGAGVAAALLSQHGIAVYSEEEFTAELLEELLHREKGADSPLFYSQGVGDGGHPVGDPTGGGAGTKGEDGGICRAWQTSLRPFPAREGFRGQHRWRGTEPCPFAGTKGRGSPS